MLPSIYTILFSDKGKYYIYNSRSNFFSEIAEELYTALNSGDFSSLPGDVIDELKKREIICDKDSKYDFYYSELMRFNTRNNDRTTMSLVLAPTTACNFACPYCFESKNNPKTINSETVDALIAFVKGHPDLKKIHITWYGGEPLLAFDKIKEIYEKLSAPDMPEIASQAIITNGYCFNDEIVEFFKEHPCSYIQITIDGLYEKHDATRCLKNSTKSTFQTIIGNIDKLVSRIPDVRINIRVNINKNNYRDFIAVAKFFKERYPEIKSVAAYPGIIREETDDKQSLCASSFTSSEMLSLNELLRKEGFDTSDFPKRSGRGCMMQDTNAYIVGPEGEIYKCWNDVGSSEAVIGNIEQTELSNPSRYIKYTMQSMPFNSNCRDCHAFPICGGGCSHHRYRNTFEDCHFDLCSPYKDKEKLIKALLSGTLSV